WSRGNEVVMVAFDRWWGGKPKLRRIIFKVIPNVNTALEQLRTHELDADVRAPNDRLGQIAAMPGIALVNYPTTTYGHFDYNVQSPLLSDARVRRALTHAIPLDVMWAKVDHRSGRRDWTPVPSFSWAYNANTPRYPYDLRAAARGLDAAGWRVGSDGLRHNGPLTMRLRMAGNVGNPELDARVLLMQSSFKQIGVAIEYFRYPTPTLFGSYATGGIVATRKYDVASYAWQLSPEPNLENQYTCTNISPKGLNYLGYCNPRFDAYVDDSLVTYDRARRKRDLLAAQRILGSDEPTVILSQRTDHIAYNNDLTGLDPSPAMIFWNAQNLAMGRPPASNSR
ncbi:MAG: ABC transporter substrate-binding protein, partial [Candidatus Eremiobacteraeota bacterium]|nr:ABC transporter substrate-binding protein [Candidatus Eremiobacteraeota bacterium]